MRQKRPIKILVCGGRNFQDIKEIKEVLDYIKDKIGNDFIIIQGGASGADILASRWAKENNIPVIEEKANWNKYGKAAGPIRNQAMLDKYAPDIVIAFQGGPGTKDMVRRARHFNALIIEV